MVGTLGPRCVWEKKDAFWFFTYNCRVKNWNDVMNGISYVRDNLAALQDIFLKTHSADGFKCSSQ